MTVSRVLYSGTTRLVLYVGTNSWDRPLVDELVVHRPFRRAVHLPLSEIWMVKLEGLDPYTDGRPLRLRVYVSGRSSYRLRLKRYSNLQPLEDFIETLQNLTAHVEDK